MSEVLTFDLGELGGEHRFRSPEQLLGWIEQELERWGWLSEDEADGFNLWHHVSRRLNHFRNQVTEALNQGRPFGSLGQIAAEFYVADQGARILHSEGDHGRRVRDIYAAEGPRAGRAAYAIAAKRVTLAAMGDPAQIAGALLLAAPSLIASDALSRQLTQERRNLRDRADRLIQTLEEEAVQRWAQHKADRLRGRQVAKRWVKRRFGQWRGIVEQLSHEAGQAQAEFAQSRQTTQQEFEGLRAAFLEAMRLQAPASYWRDKAARHKSAEDAARFRLYVFFPLLGLGLAGIFSLVAFLLVQFPPAANATPIYFIVSAGLGSLAGVSFWVGRLLTKLYLSEHHLRVDAEEREIMTTTYLALTKDQAADEKDRQIILSALFRNTPDGIVKDDGMADGTLAALLARVVGPK